MMLLCIRSGVWFRRQVPDPGPGHVPRPEAVLELDNTKACRTGGFL